MTHSCAGVPVPIVMPAAPVEEIAPPINGFPAFHYLREAVRIATWRSEAIERASRDRNSLKYGIAIWVVANAIGAVVAAEFYSTGNQSAVSAMTRFFFSLPISALLSFAQIGVCFLLAKLLMGASGRFVEILRPLALGSIVFILMAIPFAGVFLAVIAWICVFAMVFQVVADVEAFSAYVLSIVVGVALRELGAALGRFLG